MLIKALPKQIRRVCVPVPEFITQFLLSEPDTSAPILPQLAHAIAKHAGDMRLLEQIDLNEWAAFRLPEHCYFNLKNCRRWRTRIGDGARFNPYSTTTWQIS